jgi:hypothetical protein
LFPMLVVKISGSKYDKEPFIRLFKVKTERKEEPFTRIVGLPYFLQIAGIIS